MAEKYGLVFKLNAETQKRYEEKFHLDKRSGKVATGKLPLPATYVINTDGVITYAFVDVDYRKRAEPAKIIEALKALQ